MMKRIFAMLIAAPLLLGALCGALSGCAKKSDKIKIVCTVFPLYDWTRNVIGDSDKIEVILLVSDGADLHSFEPTARDAIDVRTADIVVRVGGADDAFVTELVRLGEGKDLRLCEAQGVTLQEVTVSSEHHHHEGEHDHPIDEHIWLSLKNARACVEAIYSAVSERDPDNAEIYRANADRYIESISELDRSYEELVSGTTDHKMIFADRFPFIYMTKDYGVEYEAAIEGCSTDAEVGFDTILRLADRLERWELSYIFVTEASDKKLALSVIEAAKIGGVEILTLNSLQSVRNADIEGGTTYLSIMEENLTVIERAFSK